MTTATAPAPLDAGRLGEGPSAADVARAALRRLAVEKLQPTPENYAHAFRREAAALQPPPAAGGLVFLGAVPEAPAPAPETPAANDSVTAPPSAAEVWRRVAHDLGRALREALPNLDGSAHELVAELDALESRFDAEGPTSELAAAMHATCEQAQRVLQHRHHLFDELGKLCRELTASMADLSEDESWVQGQCDAMRARIDEGLSARGVRAVSEMLSQARHGQRELKGEREQAREALRALMGEMLGELGELGARTGDFHQNVGRYADEIESSDSLDNLATVVRNMVEESRSVQQLVQQTQSRLQTEHGKATELSARVTQLEDEMRRLSDEVSTDQLTQVANRRGLAQAFEMERSRVERGGGDLSVGLIDIDNFKKLNDRLGHGAGDEALKSLAAVTRKTLRPTDHVARFGGEEFVVLLPATAVTDAQVVLTRLQRSLSSGLFMHKEEKVLVTFSAGVTVYRLGETLEEALERADRALYEAKRTGKNRTCLG